MLFKTFDKGVFFFLQCKKNRFLAAMQLSKGRSRSLTGAICRDESREKRNAFLRACCWSRGEQKRVNMGPKQRSATAMKLMKSGRASRCVDAERYSTKTLGTTLARRNMGKRSFGDTHSPDWVASSEERGLLFIPEKSSSWESCDGDREDEVWTAE